MIVQANDAGSGNHLVVGLIPVVLQRCSDQLLTHLYKAFPITDI